MKIFSLFPGVFNIKSLWPKFISILVLVVAISCDDNAEGPKGKYDHGVFVVNEGNFSSGNGTVTYFDGTATAEQNIYKNEAGTFAGAVAQSITFHEDKGYLVLNADNKVQIMNANTFERLDALTNAELDKPREVQILNNKAYVSVWGPYADGGFNLIDSYVLVIDLNTKSVVKKIETDEGTDNLLVAGNRLFASNNNFGASTTLAVIDPSSNTLVDQVELYAGPAGSVEDANGKVWVICTGTYGGADGKLYRINPASLAIEQTIELALNPNADLALTPDKQNLIYSAGTDIYKVSISATAAPASSIFSIGALVTNYSLGVNPDNGDIYVGDALDYSSAGKVYVYNESGTFKTNFDTGISPTQFVFK